MRPRIYLFQHLRELICLTIAGACMISCARGGNKTADKQVSAAASEDVVVLVNDEPIREAEVQRRMAEIIRNAPPDVEKEKVERMKPRIRHDARESLIMEKLLEQSLRREGIQVSDAQIEERWQKAEEKLKTQGSSMAEYGHLSGRSEQELRNDIRLAIGQDALFDKMLGIKPPTGEEQKKFYEENKDRYKIPEAWRVREILLAFPTGHEPTQKEKDAVKAQAKVIRERLLRGEDFAALARELSQGMTAKEGGDLGWVVEVPEIPKWLKSALEQRTGEVGEVIASDRGYHIFLVTEHRASEVPSFDEVRDRIAADITFTKRSEGAEKIVKGIRKSAKIVEPGKGG